ncbi:MAG: leucine--tRNA ligase [Candidatus Levybacteria bacterium]|nr:leucine--tRNA ligase [Candidatus Levybacteria bacterium]
MASEKNIKSKTKNVKYDPKSIELKWQSKWQQEAIYQPQLDSANSILASKDVSTEAKKSGKPYYNLMMFPYPSAEGLHVGSIYTFGGIDVYGRFQRMLGHEVFEPIGLDGYGIHSENHAIKTNTHPIDHAKRTEENFYRQLHAIGNSFAWDNKVETYNPDYYRWTQWIFVQLFKSGLAYRKSSAVNFCPSCMTVLSDEQVIDGQCERCNSVVEKKELEQWFFKITNYAERLLQNIETLDWTDKVRIAQRNWIGKKEGINITYPVEGMDETVTVFTTRPDTNYGATFIALAPEHKLALKITSKEQREVVKAYIEKSLHKSEIDRVAEGKEKTGAFTGAYAVNPLTGYKMPIWISDFVLGGFGTGALVGVPAHDKRDFQFAQKFGLDIIRVVKGTDGDQSAVTTIEQVQEEAGEMINSGFLNGMNIHDATHKMMNYIEDHKYGRREVSYHLRDWLISRQRYWGPPIPMIYCEDCATNGKSWFTTAEGHERLKIKDLGLKNPEKDLKSSILNLKSDMAGWYPEENLPVKLPYVKDFKPMGTGKSPLANYPEFYETNCPGCGKPARRETDVSDTFLDSAWYFLRYLATDLEHIPFPMPEERAKEFAGATKEEIDQAIKRQSFLPVTMYIGGAEHSVLHLLYARFVTMALHDMGYVPFEEPFSRFYAHGLIIKDGAKMSKSKGNIINPDDYIGKYGADTLRTYLLFLGPFNQGGDFRDTGVEGMNRFIKRVWTFFQNSQFSILNSQLSSESLKMMHEAIKGVTEDLEGLRFNTAIAKLMTWYNFLSKQERVSREELETYLQLFAPFAPHMTEELWESLGNPFSIHKSTWPSFDEKHLVKDTLTIAVQVNGKLRGTLAVAASDKDNRAMIEEKARAHTDVAKFLQTEPKKVIYVPGKILNFVV